MSVDSIKIDQLRYFVAAVECGGFAAAGERLNITPTSIAHGVTALEQTLGTILLVRKRASGVIPNQQGRRFLIESRKVLHEVKSLVDTFSSKTDQLSGDLIVGCQESIAWSVIPRVVHVLSLRHPNLRIMTKTVFMDQELQPLEDGEVDILVTFMAGRAQPKMSDKLASEQYFAKKLCSPQAYALLHADHPVIREDMVDISLEELVEYPTALLNDGPSQDLFRSMYDDLGLTPNIATVGNVSPVAYPYVGQTEAISLRIARPSINLSPLGDRLVFLRLRDKVRRPDMLAITHQHSDGAISRNAQGFIDVCQEKFDDGTLKANFFYD